MLPLIPLAMVGVTLVWLGRKLVGEGAETAPGPQEGPGAFVHEVQGELDLPLVVFVGRSGAGKTSLVNALLGHQLLETNDVASTTRVVQGASYGPTHAAVALVDTPGIGEAETSERYVEGLLRWFAEHSEQVMILILVVQADSKAHAEDTRLLASLLSLKPSCQVLVLLNQVDKLPPLRGEGLSQSWAEESQSDSSRAAHIREKQRLVEQQFGLMGEQILPTVARPERLFNIDAVAEAIQQRKQAQEPPGP